MRRALQASVNFKQPDRIAALVAFLVTNGSQIGNSASAGQLQRIAIVITKLRDDPTHGLEFAGYITTKIPFLKRLDVAYEQGRFRIVKDLAKELKSPIPNTRITRAELAMELWPEFKPSGTIVAQT